jgi:hypothetical protein
VPSDKVSLTSSSGGLVSGLREQRAISVEMIQRMERKTI